MGHEDRIVGFKGNNTFSRIPGAPEGWFEPYPPDSWKGYEYKAETGAPEKFEDVDNPGGWSDYVFRPKFGKDKRYITNFCLINLPPNLYKNKPELYHQLVRMWAGKK